MYSVGMVCLVYPSQPPASPGNLISCGTTQPIYYQCNQDPPRHPTILHQPPEFQFYVIFRVLGQKVNGISVSGPPKIGERPYPRQFHPVGFTPVFEYFSSKPVSGFTSNTIQVTNLTSIIPPIKHTQLVSPNSQISYTQVPYP